MPAKKHSAFAWSISFIGDVCFQCLSNPAQKITIAFLRLPIPVHVSRLEIPLVPSLFAAEEMTFIARG
jgi:hypothetical protein